MSNTDNYTPYGEEWQKEMMKWRKPDLINFLKKTLIEANSIKNNGALGDVSVCPQCHSKATAYSSEVDYTECSECGLTF
jgi:ribosomal protein S27E